MKFVGVIPFSAAERSGDYCFRLKRESEKWNGRVRNCVFVCQFSFSSSVSTRFVVLLTSQKLYVTHHVLFSFFFKFKNTLLSSLLLQSCEFGPQL